MALAVIGVTVTTLPLLILLVILALIFLYTRSPKQKTPRKIPYPAGPKPYPVIGALYALAPYQVPFEGFLALAEKYGDIFSIRMGTRDCVVINSFTAIREVLVTRGAQFGGRPDFIRWHKLFGGDRDNSLALCDWSALQRTRRHMVNSFTSPRHLSPKLELLEDKITAELDLLKERLEANLNTPIPAKDYILEASANIFTDYLCSKRFPYGHSGFTGMVKDFDNIFYDINQGYAVDFLPWLAPLHYFHFQKLEGWARRIRGFILEEIIKPHQEAPNIDEPDFVDTLLQHLKAERIGKPNKDRISIEDDDDDDVTLDWQAAMYELEDLVGGHSAVGNFWMQVLAQIAQHPEVATAMREEIDRVCGDSPVSLADRQQLPYTESTMFETLRTVSSPIVPHVATEDTSIGGFAVDSGTVVFLNNYRLNKSDKYWKEPEKFDPGRFINSEGQISKPEYFIPFSTGRRACMGYKLVQTVTFLGIARILQNFDVNLVEGNTEIKNTQPACLALRPSTFPLIFSKRSDIV